MVSQADFRAVPFFNYPHVFTSHEEDFIVIFQDIGRRGAFIAQRDMRDFEQRLATFTGARHALGFSNATDGLHIALRAAGIGPGDERFPSSSILQLSSRLYLP